jgi:hypothetical protein
MKKSRIAGTPTLVHREKNAEANLACLRMFGECWSNLWIAGRGGCARVGVGAQGSKLRRRVR